jgi:hypothetical protein
VLALTPASKAFEGKDMAAPNTAPGFLAILLAIAASVTLWGKTPAACARERPTGPVEIELEELRPGLLATYRCLKDKDAVLTRIDAKPAFYLAPQL